MPLVSDLLTEQRRTFDGRRRVSCLTYIRVMVSYSSRQATSANLTNASHRCVPIRDGNASILYRTWSLNALTTKCIARSSKLHLISGLLAMLIICRPTAIAMVTLAIPNMKSIAAVFAIMSMSMSIVDLYSA